MITVNDVLDKLNGIIANSPMGDGAKVIVLDDGFVEVDFFVLLFSTAVDMTASSLLAIDNGVIGYDRHIREWQALGYIA